MEWARAFQNVNVMLPRLNQCFHWCLYGQEWYAAMQEGSQEGSEDAFLAQAVAAMKLQMEGRENPYLVVLPQGDIPTHSELLLNA